jgi:hypothetical protein
MTVPQFRRRPHLRDDFDATLRKRDARRLADRIEQEWAVLGHDVQCTLHPVHDEHGHIVTYEVKSTLRNGLPRKAA